MWRRDDARRDAKRDGNATRVTIALAVALSLFACALLLTLSGSPLVVARSNGIQRQTKLVETPGDAEACQAGEVLPAGTSAIRMTLWSAAGPSLQVRALSGSRLLASGAIASAWSTGVVTVPIKPVVRVSSPARICVKLGRSPEAVEFNGAPTRSAVAMRTGKGQVLPGRIEIEYLRKAQGTWWSAAGSVAKRMGLGREPSGTWIVLLVLAAMGAVIATASWLVLEELR